MAVTTPWRLGFYAGVVQSRPVPSPDPGASVPPGWGCSEEAYCRLPVPTIFLGSLFSTPAWAPQRGAYGRLCLDPGTGGVRPQLLFEPSGHGQGAAALSESPSLAGKGTLKLSSDARRSVRPRVCASVGVRLEPSAAFRHSEPGLKSARGSPGGRDVDARAPRRCVVSARRVTGSMTLWGSVPFPTGCPWLPGCCRDTAGAERPAITGPPGLGLCKCIFRP